MKLVLVINSLQAGGAERVMATLANAWVADGASVTLVTMDSAESDFYPLDDRVHRVALHLSRSTHGISDKLRTGWSRIRGLRKIIRSVNPHVVISFIDQMNILTLIAMRGLPNPAIVSERIDPRHEPLDRGWRLLRRAFYPQARALVVQTEAVRLWSRRLMPVACCHAIPNPVAAPTGQRSTNFVPRIVAAGRLHRQKGFDTLISAFAKIATRLPEWTLDIFGDGPERAELTALVARHGLQDRVCLRGVVRDLQSELLKAPIFVMPSRYEGFPNALLEAMACGCAIIASDCPSGPAEIIRPGVDGLLVPVDNIVALAGTIERLVSDQSLQERLGLGARSVSERFSVDAALTLWNDLIDDVTAGRKRARDRAELLAHSMPARAA